MANKHFDPIKIEFTSNEVAHILFVLGSQLDYINKTLNEFEQCTDNTDTIVFLEKEKIRFVNLQTKIINAIKNNKPH